MQILAGGRLLPLVLEHAQAAELLGCSAWSVSSQIRKGTFPFPSALVPFGKNGNRIRAADLCRALRIEYRVVSDEEISYL